MNNVITHEGKQYREVERKAKVGELVKITNPVSNYGYDAGDVFQVVNRFSNNNGIKIDIGEPEWGLSNVFDSEYVVLEYITESPKLSTNVSVTLCEDTTKIIDMLTSLSQEVVNLRYEVEILKQKKPDDFPVITTESVRETINKMIVDGLKPKPAQAILTRAEVVAKAKADVESLKTTHYPTLDQYYTFGYRECDAEFIVNRGKRTVVCLLRDRRPYGDKTVYSKGIAKCAPDDIFNVDIGKIISLYRALGKRIPSMFTNAPKPEGVAVGDVVYLHHIGDNVTVTSDWDQEALTHQIKSGIATVIDDSDREGACC